MNELEAITTRLADKELTDLKAIVEKANENNKQHFEYGELTQDPTRYDGYWSLHFLGYVNIIKKMNRRYNHITLLPAAMYRYEHEKRNVLAKKLRIAGLKHKELMAIAAFLMSILLLVLRVLEFLGYKIAVE